MNLFYHLMNTFIILKGQQIRDGSTSLVSYIITYKSLFSIKLLITILCIITYFSNIYSNHGNFPIFKKFSGIKVSFPSCLRKLLLLSNQRMTFKTYLPSRIHFLSKKIFTSKFLLDSVYPKNCFLKK